MENVKTKSDEKADKYKQLLQLTSDMMKDGNSKDIYLYLDNIDTKTSALLTHVSIMMAVTALLWQESPEASLYRDVIGIELVSYILIAIGCLSCVNIISPNKHIKTSESLRDYAMSVLIFRLRTYKACWYGSITVTVALLLVFVAHLSAS